MSRILIAEDESRIASFLEKGLSARGYATTIATNGVDAFDLAASGEFDLLILDLGLPRQDGVDVLRRLRDSDNQIAIIVLTARDTESDTVSAFEGGADDYVTKPFRFRELLARIRVRLREERVPARTILRAGDAWLDVISRRLQVGGTAHDLTAREFALAELFFRHPRQVLSREQILDRVWGYDYEPESNIVEVYVRYLRQKLGPERISTMRGMGYRLELDVEETAADSEPQSVGDGR
jgi:two-component system, OmpR family, copper resistance phosphate regulon response regulator CusR